MAERRATQSLVHTIGFTLRQPSLLGLEIWWRWAFGIPALLLVWRQVLAVVALIPSDTLTLLQAEMYEPVKAAATLYVLGQELAPVVWGILRWLVPLLLVWWAAFSGAGRWLVFRRLAVLHPSLLQRGPAARQVAALVGLQLLRAIGLAAAFVVAFLLMRQAADWSFANPEQPNLFLYFSSVILAVIGMFTVWAVVSWSVTVAPLLVARRGAGAFSAMRDALRLDRAISSQLIEVNLVLGIIKLMMLVLAMVFSSIPLPFETATTPAQLHVWWTIVTVAYFATNAFFQVVRQIAMLQVLEWNSPLGVN